MSNDFKPLGFAQWVNKYGEQLCDLYDDMILGDINQDQIMDVLDIVQLVNIILDLTNPSTMESILADINEDDVKIKNNHKPR